MIRASVQPVLPECGWSGGSLIGANWDWSLPNEESNDDVGAVRSDAAGNDDIAAKGAPTASMETATVAELAAATLRSQSARLRGYRPTWSAETDGGTYSRAATSSIFCSTCK
jgi:hypothetical protein